MRENLFVGMSNRILQSLAKALPGAKSLRIILHRMRGVRIGKNVWIGYDTILETSRPYLIEVGNNVIINERVMVIAHFHESQGVKIEDDSYIGPGAIIMPNVIVGKGAVIVAGSIVTRSVPPATMVQGNPAKPIAKCLSPLDMGIPLRQFYKGLVPIKPK